MKRKAISTLIWIVPVVLIYGLLINLTVIYISEINLFIPPLISISGLLVVTVFQLAYLPLRKAFSRNVLLEIIYALTPSLVLLLLIFAQYKFVWTLVLLALSVLTSVILCWKVLRGGKLSFRHKKETVMRVSALVLCAVLLIPGIFSICKFDSSPYYESVELYNELLLELFGGTEGHQERLTKQELVKQNSSELQKLNADTWKKLSNQEKVDVLRLIADIEAYDLGISAVSVVRSEKLNSLYTLAEYDSESRTITIDLQHLRDPAYDVVQSVIHEMRHAYQHMVVESLPSENEVISCRFYEQPRKWREEFLNYNSGYGSEGYEAYASQSCEEDARRYSNEQAQLIFAWLDMPVEQNMIDKGE